LGLLKAGITYLPIDPSLPVERVDFLMKDAGAERLISAQKYQELYAGFNQISFDAIWAEKDKYTFEPNTDLNSAHHLVYICFTSGSTGLPKGVGISQQSLLNLLNYRLIAPGVSNHDNMIGLTTMSFDISEEELYLPLIAGAQLTIVDQDIARDGNALLEVIKSENITLMQATPYIWQMMIEAGWKEKLPLVAFCGGEALTKQLANQLLERCKELWNMYGPTETTICTMAKKLNLTDELITIGKPIANAAVYVLNENLQKVEAGLEGELYISGIGVANGYINRPELSAQKFIPDPFSANFDQKMYSTGDLVKQLPNGDLQFLGRIDTQVKVRGYRIETEEIEHQLKMHKAIKDALVVVFKDVVANARLVAYLTLQSGAKNNTALALEIELKENLKKALPEYMVPVDYVFINEMPLLPSGKVDRKRLPAPEIKNNSASYVAPHTNLEQIITDIWINNIGIKTIGVNDNFFALGGTSLIALKTKIQIEKKLNKRLSPSILFKFPTIKELANYLESAVDEDYKSLVPIKTKGSKIPLYMVHGIGLNVLTFKDMVDKMDDDQPVYGLQAVDIDHQTTPLNTFEKIAAFYNSEIIKHNPNGPYAISGYSIGGVIAYEMVKQLKEQGKDVKLLVMFDTAIQLPTHQYPFLKKLFRKGLRQFPKLKFRVQTLYHKPVKTVKYLINFYKNELNTLVNKRFGGHDLPEYMVKTMDSIVHAFYQYKIIAAPIHIDLFVADKLFFLDDPKFLGWKNYANKGVTTYHIAGGHDDLFYPPFGGEVANLLQKRLNEIND
jgi:amino acid adenylation domain-containing protein